jgi:hypothetical protein
MKCDDCDVKFISESLLILDSEVRIQISGVWFTVKILARQGYFDADDNLQFMYCVEIVK